MAAASRPERAAALSEPPRSAAACINYGHIKLFAWCTPVASACKYCHLSNRVRGAKFLNSMRDIQAHLARNRNIGKLIHNGA